MGCTQEKAVKRQQNNNTFLHYYIFDVLAYNGKSVYTEKIEKGWF